MLNMQKVLELEHALLYGDMCDTDDTKDMARSRGYREGVMSMTRVIIEIMNAEERKPEPGYLDGFREGYQKGLKEGRTVE